MTVDVPNELAHFVEQKIKSGAFASPDQVVHAGLEALRQQSDGDFAAGELMALLKEPDAQIDRGETFDGPTVFDEIRILGAKRRASLP